MVKFVTNAMRFIVKIVPLSGLHVMIAMNILVKIVTWTARGVIVLMFNVAEKDVANVQNLKVS